MTDWTPLLGIPYAEADCRAIVGRGLDLLGISLRNRSKFDEAPASLAGYAKYIADGGEDWGYRGAWPVHEIAVGDVVVCVSGDPPDQRAHLALIIDPEHGRALTTLENAGSIILPIRAIPGEKSVWRLACK